MGAIGHASVHLRGPGADWHCWHFTSLWPRQLGSEKPSDGALSWLILHALAFALTRPGVMATANFFNIYFLLGGSADPDCLVTRMAFCCRRRARALGASSVAPIIHYTPIAYRR